jgi:hypothetical protein
MSPGEMTTVELMEFVAMAPDCDVTVKHYAELGRRAERLRGYVRMAGTPAANRVAVMAIRAINAASSGIAPPGSVSKREASEDAKDSDGL